MLLSTMNWKRGLLRLWAVVAVLWVGVAFYSNDTVQRVRDAYAVDDWTPVGPSAAAPVAPRDLLAARPWENDPIVSAAAPLKPSIWPPLFDFAKLAFIPPLLLLALGYIGLWVGRGFRQQG